MIPKTQTAKIIKYSNFFERKLLQLKKDHKPNKRQIPATSH